MTAAKDRRGGDSGTRPSPPKIATHTTGWHMTDIERLNKPTRLPDGRFASVQTTKKKTTGAPREARMQADIDKRIKALTPRDVEDVRTLAVSWVQDAIGEHVKRCHEPGDGKTRTAGSWAHRGWHWLAFALRLVIVLALVMAALAIGFLAGRLTA